MNAPQVIMIIIFALGLGISLARHGKEYYQIENWWITLLGVCVQAAILWWGGFWE